MKLAQDRTTRNHDGVFNAIKLSCLTGFTALCAAHGQFQTNLPSSVKLSIRNQIHGYFPNVKLNGIPFLDRTVNWDDFNKWPDEFIFQGTNMAVHMENIESDYGERAYSRKELRNHFSATYGAVGVTNIWGGPTWDLPVKPFGVWHGGRITEAHIRANGAEVFGMQFYSSGGLYSYHFQEKAGHWWFEYYDKSGRRVGYYFDDREYHWEGRSVSFTEFDANRMRLWAKEDGPKRR